MEAVQTQGKDAKKDLVMLKPKGLKRVLERGMGPNILNVMYSACP